jgi:hypothetical protein
MLIVLLRVYAVRSGVCNAGSGWVSTPAAYQLKVAGEIPNEFDEKM